MAGSNVQAAMRRRRSSGRSFMSVSLAGILFSTTFSSMINMGMINDIVTANDCNIGDVGYSAYEQTIYDNNLAPNQSADKLCV